jgi:hypothetical protein
MQNIISFRKVKITKAMKFLTCLLSIAALTLASCTLNDNAVRPDMQYVKEDMVHLNVYIELLPDPTLSPDEQCNQGNQLRLKSREGFQISFYRVSNSTEGDTRVRYGVTNREGNYSAHDLDPATYRVVATDTGGEVQERLLTPPLGQIVNLTFSFD